ncbi:hypothetical protein [Noviluteimonas gilva]|uniref:Uncharacterized protein n=1 Tax=Noviluteimonas gilva TaxID=2682097 RepID=A0A7C9HL88_9GAMM|nr:hypothetical protein [Lysobacter gilvus]MUV13532.1 hypothetical protein [Lysobacter gilvus]
MAYDNTNTFTLFVNDKDGNDKRPDRSGTLNVDGVEYFIDGWIKQGSKGPFLSGKIKRKDRQGSESKPVQAAAEFADDDVLF